MNKSYQAKEVIKTVESGLRTLGEVYSVLNYIEYFHVDGSENDLFEVSDKIESLLLECQDIVDRYTGKFKRL